ncbi:hypothetical protein MMC12_007710 [Toensbergia leucococca]|nr:hypothetical protein [Toensbergia leucococca]
MEILDLSDTETEDPFASPSRIDDKPRKVEATDSTASETNEDALRLTKSGSKSGSDEALGLALRRELEGVRDINEIIEGVNKTLERARGNMDAVSRTVSNASILLDSWTRILSQTEHNQRLILNPNWQGSSQDIADAENESLLKQQEKERKDFDEMQRREASTRKAEEEEKRRAELINVRGVRGQRARGGGTGRTVTQNAYAGIGGPGGTRGSRGGAGAATRAQSTFGRGSSGGRGSGRGLT